MKAALLIGFGYLNQPKGYRLPGIIIDLYRAHQWSLRMNVKRWYILTDHTTNIESEKVLKLVIKKELEGEAIFFIDRIKKEQIYHNYQDYSHLIAELQALLVDVSHLFVYYSGHFENGLVVFPKGGRIDTDGEAPLDRFPLDQVIRYGITRAKPEIELFVVLDCCQSNGLDLSFRMKTNESRFSFVTPGRTLSTGNCLCFSSGTEEESAKARMDGSPFTYRLFHVIEQLVGENDTVLFERLLIEIVAAGYNRSPMVGIVHPITKKLPRWCYTTTTTLIDFHPIENIFYVK